MGTMNDEIKKAVQVMRQGGVILYPTDTIWGLGCDATNAEAVNKIFQIKERQESKALIVLVDSIAKVQGYVDQLPDIAWDLIEIADKPLTIIYQGARQLAHNLIAEDGSIAIRVTNEQFSKRLCEQFRLPIVSTSANMSGMPSPAFFDEITPQIRTAVDYVVDWRQDDKTPHLPSSIIKLGVNGQVQIVRP